MSMLKLLRLTVSLWKKGWTKKTGGKQERTQDDKVELEKWM